MAASAVVKRRVLSGSADLTLPLPTPLSDDWAAYSGAYYAAHEYIAAHLARDVADWPHLIPLPSPSVETAVWLHAHLRLLLVDLQSLLGCLSAECSARSCPVMQATADWEFLCAAHGPQPVKCCAMGYMAHSLSAFTATLNDAALFPSRVGSITPAAAAHFPPLCRRAYRLFAHAFFHHRALFDGWEEGRRGCMRFLSLVQHFELMDQSQLTPRIPITAYKHPA